MQCPKCNTENRESAKFCRKCGGRLAVVCPQCEAELAPDSRFCDECGSQLSAAAEGAEPSGAETVPDRLQRLVPKEYAERLLATRGQVQPERRTVTILFSDVKGSTAMAEDLDPEDVLDIMSGAFDVLIEPIYRYEGTLARLMGDAILAFFGAPIAHEDDPERACRAALEITAQAAEYAQKLERERGIKGFNVRVGINTGLVVVGEVGSDLRVEYTAMGDAINLAARMESAAEPGTVLISEHTHKLIGPLFETEALGPIEVKGRRKPIPVFRVLAAKELPGKVRGIAGLESPLVGRQAEFAAMQEALQGLQLGMGGIVTIVGEAGIGKSRLVAELRKEAPPGTQWVEGRCLSYGTSIAYLLWLDVLRALLGTTVEDSPHTVRDTLRHQVRTLCPERVDDVDPYLTHLMALPLEPEVETALQDMDGAQLKANTFQAVRTLMQCAASERPLVLVCEDLHWADPTSIELLQQLLALTERVPLLLLCVFRPLKEHGCWRFRELTAQTYAHRHTDIVLDPLSPAQSEALVANLLRIEELPDVLRERILSRAEGNPFYVEEVIRSLIDRSAIVQEKATGRWTATRAVAEIPIPDTLQGVLMARIDRLQEDAKRVLQMASVIGRIFLYRVLVDIAEEERTLDEQLLTLQHEEMIRERTRIPELEYIFKHDLTREAAYNGLLKKERRVFHRQVGEALETLFPDRVEEQLGLLAYHWERAGDAEKATEYLLRAGDQARLLYAHAEAIDYYERALVFLEEQEEHERAARTLMKLGLTHQIAFDFKHARQAYERAFSMWQRVPSSEAAVTPAPAPHALREWGFVDSVDPALAFDPISLNVASALFSGLTQRRPELDVAPDVAQRWEVLEHGRKYLFHLRDDVRWSDGVRLTAQDFEYAWKRVLDPATGALTASLLYDVKGARDYHCGREANPDSVGVRALDGLTLMVELEKPTGHFLRLLDAFAYAVPRHVVERHSTAWTELDNIVTTGAFRLESWQRGELAVLVRNPDYHGNFRGNVQRVELRRVRDWGAQLQMYEAGELDALWLFPGHYSAIELDRAREGHADEYVSSPELSTYFVSFDVGRTPFQDSRVRRAFALAIDKEALAHVVMGGYRFPASGGFVPPGIPGHSAGIGLAYDPQVARRLLAEAGYAGGSAFPVVQGTTMARGDWIEYLQAQWREHLAVETRWERVEMEGLPTRNSRDRPHLLAHAHIADYPDPHNFLSTHMPWNRLGWRHDGFEELVEEASRVMDQARRLKLYMQADRILVEEAAIVPLTYGRWHWLVKPWVRNYLGGWMDIVIDPH